MPTTLELTTQPWIPPVIVLGVAERAHAVWDGNTNLQKWNLLGLKDVILSYFYPLNIGGLHIALAIRQGALHGALKLRLLADDDSEVGTLTLTPELVPAGQRIATRQIGPPLIRLLPDSWSVTFLQLPADTMVLLRSGLFRFVAAEASGIEHTVGRIEAVIVSPPPLTPDRIAAIRSDPNALREVRVFLVCRKCDSRLVAFASLDRADVEAQSDDVWYSDLPETFNCSCGTNSFDLKSLRTNLHGLLGQALPFHGEGVGSVRLYEKSALRGILRDFTLLLSQNPREEVLQKFIEENPVLLHQFPAERLFVKPPILTFFKADFAILTASHELLLIEIERSATKLLRKNGDEAAELHHAIDQVQRWLHVVSDHRLAVLSSLDLDPKAVGAIRGVVIAGRDKGQDAQHLRRAKGVDRGQVRFLTFDDLAFSMRSLIRGIENM